MSYFVFGSSSSRCFNEIFPNNVSFYPAASNIVELYLKSLDIKNFLTHLIKLLVEQPNI